MQQMEEHGNAQQILYRRSWYSVDSAAYSISSTAFDYHAVEAEYRTAQSTPRILRSTRNFIECRALYPNSYMYLALTVAYDRTTFEYH